VKVRLSTSLVDGRKEHHDGDVVDLPRPQALAMIDRGSATPVAETPADGRKTRTKTALEKRGK
jgi:hypothetical protein